MPIKIGFLSLGCPKNQVDSEVMMGLLISRGFEITSKKEEAEILIVNTCGFIDPAKEESIQAILEMVEMKKRGSCRKLIVAGCLAERYREEVRREIPEVDAVLGVHQLNDILMLCREKEETIARQTPLSSDPSVKRVLTTPAHYAYLKISEGCSHECSFCVIPHIRGKHHSRRLSSLLQEAEELASAGVRELNLISQDTTAYGSDLGMKNGLAKLLRKLIRIAEIRRIRFLYAYPNTIDREVLELMASESKICSYLDLPLQHVSRRILKDMQRGGTGHSLERLIRRIRDTVPNISLRTAMIVGYPGETDAEFAELMDFCRNMRFDHLGVFCYSEQEGTIAAGRQPKISPRTAENRRRRLMRQQETISRQINRRRIGQTIEVFLDGVSSESEWLYVGRTEFQAPEIDGVVFINDSRVENLQVGGLYQVKITRAWEHDLIGYIVRSAEETVDNIREKHS
jgi:ribosomal protein S12 methylthiotransferase